MSKKSTWLTNFLGKYWFIQITLITALVLYSILASVSIFVLVDNNGLGSSNTQENSKEVVISIIFDSQVSSKPITWNSVVTTVKTNSTLFNVMNRTFSIAGHNYISQGFFITKINNITQDGTNSWTYYYYSKGSGWIYALSGVSHFILNHDYQIKWVYGTGGF